MTVSDLKQSHPEDIAPKINWAKMEEADNFAKTVKLFRQGKYDEDSFRRFRLQHGAYGTRMTGDYAMVTNKKHLQEKFILINTRKNCSIKRSIFHWKCAFFNSRKHSTSLGNLRRCI